MIIDGTGREIPSEELPSYPNAANGGRPESVVVDSKRPFQSNGAAPSSSAPSQPPATNFLRISKNDGSIRERWTIDPTLSVPEAFLVPLPDGETTRDNLKITANDGAIRADICLVSGSGSLSPDRAALDMMSKDGSIEVKLRRDDLKPRFSLRALACDGSITIWLPGNFHGPIYHRTSSGWTKFAGSLESSVATFSNESKTGGRSFIGDWQNSGFGEKGKDAWTGDEVNVETKDGSITFKLIDDEEKAPVAGASGGFMGSMRRLFPSS